jgi:hypothetical protein
LCICACNYQDGDALKTDELSSALKALVGIDDLPEGALNAQSFVGQVLGLEEGGEKDYEGGQSNGEEMKGE